MKKNLAILVLIIVVGVVAFYAGLNFSSKRNSLGDLSDNMRDLRRLSSEERQQIFEQGGNHIDRRAGQAGFNLTNGEIIDKNGTSLTVKLLEGGSKIIFFSDSTYFTKSVESSVDDFTVGEQISVRGSENSDGSITARSVQVTKISLEE